jgi:hypothetical protein
MNASHASNVGPANLHPAAAPPVRRPRTALLVLYALLVAQLAIWSTMAARIDLAAAFTQAHQGAEAELVVGGAVWLVLFMLAVATATIRYRQYNR